MIRTRLLKEMNRLENILDTRQLTTGRRHAIQSRVEWLKFRLNRPILYWLHCKYRECRKKLSKLLYNWDMYDTE